MKYLERIVPFANPLEGGGTVFVISIRYYVSAKHFVKIGS
jgi:hypothetical protein